MKKLALASILFTAACATTDVTNSWKAPEATQHKPEKTLVVGLVPSETTRRNLEQDLSADLKKEGVNAVPSAQYFEEQKQLTPEAVRQVAEREGFDTVLVSTFRGVESKMEYSPGYGYSYYWGYWDPGYYYEQREAKLETTLFENEDGGKMVWSATSETLATNDVSKKTGEVADKVVGRMKKDAVL